MAVTIRRIGYGPSTLAGSGSGFASRYQASFNSTTSWTVSGDDYIITIPESTHNKGLNPSVIVYLDNTVTFEEVIVPITINALGDITIYVTNNPDNRFAGKAVII